MQQLSVHPEVLQYIGNLALTKHLEVERATRAEERFQKVFELLSNVAWNQVKPQQLWIDLKNKTWEVRPLDTPPSPAPIPVTAVDPVENTGHPV